MCLVSVCPVFILPSLTTTLPKPHSRPMTHKRSDVFVSVTGPSLFLFDRPFRLSSRRPSQNQMNLSSFFTILPSFLHDVLLVSSADDWQIFTLSPELVSRSFGTQKNARPLFFCDLIKFLVVVFSFATLFLPFDTRTQWTVAVASST